MKHYKGNPVRMDDADFPDKIGRDPKEPDVIRVRFQGQMQTPRFRSPGAAHGFLEGLRNGTRKPEPEQR